jgi:hypothetical protein
MSVDVGRSPTIKEEGKMIKNLHHDQGGSWTWRNSNGESRGVYYTTRDGEGIFFQDDLTGSTRQITGLCQFQACDTASGMRRKLNKMFDEWSFDRTF